jgi:hypothetical protein
VLGIKILLSRIFAQYGTFMTKGASAAGFSFSTGGTNILQPSDCSKNEPRQGKKDKK